ncbi:MAG: kaiC 2 [Phycisphaerales bacterium]|jgi:circadian clock protein KaiC|nr:kaiC 2 [Phycisphaerales bacterium]
MKTHRSPSGQLVSTGVSGLDDILRGGLTPNRLYLVEGDPGSGKTTLALQFLLEGARRGEPALYVTLSETKDELMTIADSHGWDISSIRIMEMAPSASSLSPDAELTMFHPSELELSETTKSVLAEVEKFKPRRVVFDSLSEMRLLAQNALRYRRQILGLKQFFAGKQSTVLLLDDRTAPGEDLQLQSIAHGVVRVEQLATGYGAERRRLRVFKMRGISFRGGFHDFAIRRGGLDVFPRLVASEHHNDFPLQDAPTGIATLDRLLGGGLPHGSSTLLIGPAGVGKSTVALQFAVAAVRRGERAALFAFDETVATLKTRSMKLGIPLDPFIQNGLLTIQQIDPAELSPGEFVAIIRRAVDGADGALPAKVVVIDSLNGYLHSMPEESFLNAQLHELFVYLNQRGVLTLMTVTQSGMMGSNVKSPVDTTYLADNVILFRYFEARGHVRRAISVVKKRAGAHEQTIREMRIGAGGIIVGAPLENFQGVLTGTPTFHGSPEDLLARMKEDER